MFSRESQRERERGLVVRRVLLFAETKTISSDGVAQFVFVCGSLMLYWLLV